MKIKTYINNSEPNKMTKKLVGDKTYLDCNAITPMSITDPKIILSDTNFNPRVNYLYIIDLNRYYFIKNKTTTSRDMWEIECHIDVLSTFSDQIKDIPATFKRQEYLYNMYLGDSEFKLQSKNDIVTKYFPNSSGFEVSANSFILTVAGG